MIKQITKNIKLTNTSAYAAPSNLTNTYLQQASFNLPTSDTLNTKTHRNTFDFNRHHSLHLERALKLYTTQLEIIKAESEQSSISSQLLQELTLDTHFLIHLLQLTKKTFKKQAFFSEIQGIHTKYTNLRTRNKLIYAQLIHDQKIPCTMIESACLASIESPTKITPNDVIGLFNGFVMDGFIPSVSTITCIMQLTNNYPLHCTINVNHTTNKNDFVFVYPREQVGDKCTKGENTRRVFDLAGLFGMPKKELYHVLIESQFTWKECLSVEKEYLRSYQHTSKTLLAMCVKGIAMENEVLGRLEHAHYLGIPLKGVFEQLFVKASEFENSSELCLGELMYFMKRCEYNEGEWGLFLCAARIDDWVKAEEIINDAHKRGVFFERWKVFEAMKKGGTLKDMIMVFKILDTSI